MTTIPMSILAFKRSTRLAAGLKVVAVISLVFLALFTAGCNSVESEINVSQKADLSTTQRIEIYEQVTREGLGYLYRAEIVGQALISQVLDNLDHYLSLKPGAGDPDLFHLRFIQSDGQVEVMGYSVNRETGFLHGPQTFWDSKGIVPPEDFIEVIDEALKTSSVPTSALSDSMIPTVASILLTRYGLDPVSFEFDWKREETTGGNTGIIEYTYISDQWIVVMSCPIDRELVYNFDVKVTMVNTGKEWQFLLSNLGELSGVGW